MPGFNYGGYGDGTGWSSESGGPAPGGGMHGNSGGQRGDNANSSNSVSQQISAIQNDQKLKQKVVNMLIAARKMNPEAKMILEVLLLLVLCRSPLRDNLHSGQAAWFGRAGHGI